MDGVISGVKVVFFDVDDTLYSPSCGLGSVIVSNIDRFLVEYTSVSLSDAPAARRRYQKHGTALAGLVAEAGSGFDIDRYIRFVYGDIDYSAHIKPNPTLRELIREVGKNRRVWAFSNAHKEHVLHVLKALDMPLDLLEGIVEARGLGFKNKPSNDAFERALFACGDCDARQALLIDDKFLNIEAARNYGMQAVHIANTPGECPSEGCREYQAITASPRFSKQAQSCMQDVMHLKVCYPDLFRAGN